MIKLLLEDGAYVNRKSVMFAFSLSCDRQGSRQRSLLTKTQWMLELFFLRGEMWIQDLLGSKRYYSI
jgi:hypothetical protein